MAYDDQRQHTHSSARIGNVETELKDGEPIEIGLKRFRNMCQRSGVLREARRAERYEKPSVKRRRKRQEAERRARKARRKGDEA